MAQRKGSGTAKTETPPEKKDYSLKEGEVITVDIGGRGRRQKQLTSNKAAGETALFSIAPPPSKGSPGTLPVLAPPPSARDVKAERRRSREHRSPKPPEADYGFGDGEFGEFQ